jgi:hypothetical protein
VTAPSLDELAALAPAEDEHPEATVKIMVGDLRALLALIPCARELEATFGTYEVPQPDQPHV